VALLAPGLSRQAVTFVRLCCPACAYRYSLVVDPDCAICSGVGTIAAKVPAGVSPVIAARAVTRGLDWWVGQGIDRELEGRIKSLRDKGLLVDDNEHAYGLADVPEQPGDRSQVGRKAGQLLKGEKPKPYVPRPPKPIPPPPTPEELERGEADRRAAMAEWQARMVDREMAEERQAREERAAERALDAILDAHPEEFAETLETERVMAALEDMPEVHRRRY
jgi:hypothetical protein